MKKAKYTYLNGTGEVDWRGYRRQKMHTIILSIISIPFCLFCGYLLPKFYNGDTTPAYAVFIVFLLYWTFVFQGYMTIACPACSKIYHGCQLYRKTCPQCGVTINPKAEKPPES